LGLTIQVDTSLSKHAVIITTVARLVLLGYAFQEDRPADLESLGLFEVRPLSLNPIFNFRAERFIRQASASFGRKAVNTTYDRTLVRCDASPEPLFSLKSGKLC
jgi:hypothetical protein